MVFISLLSSIIILLSIWSIGKFIFKKNLAGEIIIALLLGLFWEILTAPAWTYDVNRLTVFYVSGEEIPIEIVLGWGYVLGTVALILHIIQTKIFHHRNVITYFVAGLVSILAVAVIAESVGFNTGVWIYTTKSTFYVPVINLPLRVVFGWMFYGTTFLATIRVYQSEIEKRIFGKAD